MQTVKLVIYPDKEFATLIKESIDKEVDESIKVNKLYMRTQMSEEQGRIDVWLVSPDSATALYFAEQLETTYKAEIIDL